MTYYTYSDELYHHGIKGQKWGRRRFQNEDGSLTSAGRERYSVSIGGATRRAYAKVLSTSAKINRAFGNRSMASSKEQIARRQLKKADAADKEALAKREARDREFAKKHLGMNDSDYDAAMKAANDAIARRKATKEMTKNSVLDPNTRNQPYKSQVPQDAKSEKIAKREARDREFAKKHLGMNDSDYDAAMKAADEAIARRKAGNKAEKPTAVVKTRSENAGKRDGKLVKAAKVAANVATLGATGRIEKSEKAYRKAQEKGTKETAVGLALKGYARASAYKGNKIAMNMLRTTAASAAVAAYVASSGNPKVKAGAMAAGKIVSAMATANIAVSTAYNAYAQARDTKHYVDQQREKYKKKRGN